MYIYFPDEDVCREINHIFCVNDKVHDGHICNDEKTRKRLVNYIYRKRAEYLPKTEIHRVNLYWTNQKPPYPNVALHIFCPPNEMTLNIYLKPSRFLGHKTLKKTTILYLPRLICYRFRKELKQGKKVFWFDKKYERISYLKEVK